MTSVLWPAQLDHLTRESDQPEKLVEFYARALTMNAQFLGKGESGKDRWHLQAPGRELIIQRGQRGAQVMHAFRMTGQAHLEAMRLHCDSRGLPIESADDSLFDTGFSVRDPEGRQVVFGLRSSSDSHAGAAGTSLPGRLQHVVVATDRFTEVVAFYERELGFVPSDYVHDGDPALADFSDTEVTAAFLRSDPEHHSFAAFKAPQSRADHLCFETNEWNDIRDWADHMGSLNIKLWWGPGRHGPGNNLFFMIEDPDGYKLELSAELEHLQQQDVARRWTHEERTLNLWGNAWMRS